MNAKRVKKTPPDIKVQLMSSFVALCNLSALILLLISGYFIIEKYIWEIIFLHSELGAYDKQVLDYSFIIFGGAALFFLVHRKQFQDALNYILGVNTK